MDNSPLCSSALKEKSASDAALKGSDGESLADLAFVEGKRVKWSLKLGDDNEFYLHLKDIEYVDSSLDLKSFLRPKANRTQMKPSAYLTFHRSYNFLYFANCLLAT